MDGYGLPYPPLTSPSPYGLGHVKLRMQLSFLAILLIEVLITMETVRILPPYSKFPVLSPHQVSILSWNILLPNSKDGWWCYKMYSPKHNIDLELTEWPARGSLIRSTIEHMNADIVCLQELCGESFYEDFDFMAELGYVSALYKKGRFRPATFWKPDVVQLVSDPIHKDRSLILHFSLLPNKISYGLQMCIYKQEIRLPEDFDRCLTVSTPSARSRVDSWSLRREEGTRPHLDKTLPLSSPGT